MTSKYRRIHLEYLIYGAGLFLSSIQYVIKWRINFPFNLVQNLLASEPGVVLNLSIVIVTLTVTNLIFLYMLLKIEQIWDLRLIKKQQFWKMRPYADNGIWLVTLFPLTLLAGSLAYFNTCSTIYLITTTLASDCMILSLVFLYKGGKENTSSPKLCQYVFIYLPIAVVSTLFLHYVLLLRVWIGFFFSTCAQTLCLSLIKKIICDCPFSFTLGEVFTVAQIITAAISACILWSLKRMFSFLCIEDVQCDNGPEVTQFLMILALGSGIILAVVSSYPWLFKKTLPFYSLCAIGTIIIFPTWFGVLHSEPMTWLFHFSTTNFQRIFLIGHWIACVVVAISIVTWRNFQGLQATTTERKYFHIVSVLIYSPALIWDREMLFLASGVVLFFLFVMEMMRVLKMPPLGKSLDDALRIFLDEKDVGNLILSHIYLLVGCSLPLWIAPSSLGLPVATLSGILSVGFGDTVASICGSMWGVHKFPDSKKSVEGTLCAIVVQLLATFLLLFYVNIPLSSLDMIHICLATVLCCGLEAFTNQVDNLVLPLFLYLMLITL